MSRVLVLGLGVSGTGVVKLLFSQGHTVVGVEEKLSKEKELELAPLVQQGMRLVSRVEDGDLKECAFAVVSPGIAPHSGLYQTVERGGIEIIGEADYCFRGVRQPVIGITGTNGKTTVTKLVEHVLNGAGRPARALGNVGASLGEYFVDPKREEIVVAEMSSYQLYRFEQPVFDLGVILNLGEDHLLWHGSMEAYAQAKFQMGSCLKEGGRFFIHEEIKNEYEQFLKMIPFDTFGGIVDEKIATNLLGEYRKLPKHDLENLVAAWALTAPFGVTQEQFLMGVRSFQKPEHRIERVAQIDGVNYINDSKGTNVSAVIAAVLAMEGPIFLIAGGEDKGGSFAPWIPHFLPRVKRVFAIGDAAEKIKNEIGAKIEVEVVGTMDKAVKRASEMAKSGDNILLSPGCASFDQFRNYRHRGDAFKNIVKGRNTQ